jgi:hypothetical protein
MTRLQGYVEGVSRSSHERDGNAGPRLMLRNLAWLHIFPQGCLKGGPSEPDGRYRQVERRLNELFESLRGHFMKIDDSIVANTFICPSG